MYIKITSNMYRCSEKFYCDKCIKLALLLKTLIHIDLPQTNEVVWRTGKGVQSPPLGHVQQFLLAVFGTVPPPPPRNKYKIVLHDIRKCFC